jgi:hypothetical protein
VADALAPRDITPARRASRGDGHHHVGAQSHHPAGARTAVQFTVTVAWRTTFIGATTLDFGDSTNNGVATGNVIGTGTDSAGNGYTVEQYQVLHTYAAAGAYTAFFQGSARVAGLQNGGGASFRVETTVDLTAGNTGGPVSAAPAIIQMQVGNVRTYTFPAFDPDGDVVACRFATTAEMWSSNVAGDGPAPPAAQNIPTEPVGNQQPTLSNTPAGCVVTWDLTQAQPGKQYVLHVVLESSHGGQSSSTAVDLLVETVTPPPPICAGTGLFFVDVGQAFSTSTVGTHSLASSLTMNAISAPSGSSFTPASGSAGPSPLSNVFSWTPTAASAGTTTIVIVNYSNALNLTATCFLTLQVPQCANYGTPCAAGVGACHQSGTNVCSGPGITVCNAVPSSPTAETCDGIDNDCNGVIDDGTPGGGVACSTGLLGVCAEGATVCANGALECTASVSPGAQSEICDGKDNNCDGTADEGFGLGAACSSGAGLCSVPGVIACDAMGTSSCNAIPKPPVAEDCTDLVDNDCDGVVNNGCADADSDGDGLLDVYEKAIGTDPKDADSDDDGVPDGQEINPSEDSDGDGLINALDPDSDNDGLYDGTEMGKDCGNPDTNMMLGHCIADADKGATTTDPLDPDTDHGSVNDGTEDANQNGKLDPGETDPNVKSDDVAVPGCTTDKDCGGASSGKVCDGATKTCSDGCRGDGGNGCPDGKVCSSTSVTIGVCGDGAGGGAATSSGSTSASTSGAGGSASDAVVATGDGFTCSASPANENSPGASWLLAGALTALVGGRRRRRVG